VTRAWPAATSGRPERPVAPPGYVTRTQDGAIPEVVRRWQHEVHVPGVYDLEVDTSAMSPEDAADAIGRRLPAGSPTAFADLAAGA